MVTPLILMVLLFLPWQAGQVLRRPALGAYGPVAVFAFTGVGHFLATAPMEEMLPPFVRAPTFVVLASGVFELLLAGALAWPRTRRAAGWVALAFLAATLPLNVYAAWHAVGPGGHRWGPAYLWIRVPLQAILAAGVFAWSVRDVAPTVAPRD